jgi:hypothetical protein
MTSKQRFRTLAILFGELMRIPDYNGEADRLYQRLRRRNEPTRGRVRESEATTGATPAGFISAARRRVAVG